MTRSVLSLAAFAALAAVVAACDTSPTEPSTQMKAAGKIARIDGDTLQCRSGWTIIAGRYVCNEDQ